jgi:5-methylcytosine-specific restriction endonuclease McrA
MRKEVLRFDFFYPSFSSEEQLDSAINGKLKVYFNDEPFLMKLSQEGSIIYENAKKKGFIKQKGINWRTYTRAYFFWCQIHNWPFIAVMEKSAFSCIQIDLITISDFVRKGIPERITEALIELVRKYSKPSDTSLSALEINHIPTLEAERVAVLVRNIVLDDKTENVQEMEIQRLAPTVLLNQARMAKPFGGKVKTETYSYLRNRYVSAFAKKRANGKCQLCGVYAPFNDINSEPYLETHHIVWLSKEGEDSIENTVALCPNCHRKMHILNLPADIQFLQNLATNLDIEK